jgi:hypothetical protein
MGREIAKNFGDFSHVGEEKKTQIICKIVFTHKHSSPAIKSHSLSLCVGMPSILTEKDMKNC